MTLAVVYTRAQLGLKAPLVTVETHLSNGLPAFSIVGLPETAVKESKERVRSALLNANFEFPDRRITINLAPADLPKQGGRYDLPIALGILAASNQIPTEPLAHYEFAGELTLAGELNAIKGCLPLALQTQMAERQLIVPQANAAEAALVKNLTVYSARHLLEVCAHLRGMQFLPRQQEASLFDDDQRVVTDLKVVRGQHQAKRALTIAAAGGHHLLMSGPPGTGKTLLASCLAGILPALSEQQALEVAAIASLSQQSWSLAQWGLRPFRTPHHTASAVALVGGGGQPRPGEISLAHHGVLFLDELPEFAPRVLEVLREPLEAGEITISRAAQQTQFPARFQLVAAMNPCPCGHHGNPQGNCRCTSDQVQRYRQRLSGPLLDRIDLQIDVPTLPLRALASASEEENAPDSATVRAAVTAAQQRQYDRCGQLNVSLSNAQLQQHCALPETLQTTMLQRAEKLNLSARSYHRTLKVARTIADLENSDAILEQHLLEALSYRDHNI